MKINKLNYENYIIDYIEGSMNVDMKSEFDLFIKSHPEIHKEIKEYLAAPIYEEDKNIVFESKMDLIKSDKSPAWLKIGGIAFAMLLIAGFGMYSWNSNATIQNVNDSTLLQSSFETTNGSIETMEKESIQKDVEVNKYDEKSDIKSSELNDSNLQKVDLQEEKKSDQNNLIQSEERKGIQFKNKEKQPVNNHYAVEYLKDPQTVKYENVGVDKVEEKPNSEVALEIDNEELNLLEEVTEISSLSNERLRPTKKPRRTVVLHMAKVTPAEYEFDDNKSKILDLFIPKSYKDIELKNSVVLSNSDNNKNILKAFAPKSISK